MHSKLKSLFVFVIGLIFIVIIFELINGFWFKSELEKNLLQLNAIYDIDLKIDPNDYYKNNEKITYRRDSYGLRDDCKNTHKIKMISIGGSTTDQRYIDFPNTFQKILQNKLRKNNFDICISNAGVDGHTSLGHKYSIKKWFPLIKGFNPKYYLLYLGINDAVLINKNKVNKEQNNFLTFLKFKIIENSYLYWFYNKIKNILMLNDDRFGILSHKKDIQKFYKYESNQENTKFKKDLIRNADQFRVNFAEILKIIKKNNSIPICVTQPHRFIKDKKGISKAFKYKDGFLNGIDLNLSLSLINNQMKNLCHENNGFFLDINEIYFDESDFYDFVHLNNKGNKKLANFLYQELKSKLN